MPALRGEPCGTEWSPTSQDLVREQAAQHVAPSTKAILRAHSADLYNVTEDSPAELKRKIGGAHLRALEAMNNSVLARQAERARLREPTPQQTILSGAQGNGISLRE